MSGWVSIAWSLGAGAGLVLHIPIHLGLALHMCAHTWMHMSTCAHAKRRLLPASHETCVHLPKAS